jgi:hypothetical protein
VANHRELGSIVVVGTKDKLRDQNVNILILSKQSARRGRTDSRRSIPLAAGTFDWRHGTLQGGWILLGDSLQNEFGTVETIS